MRIILSFTRLKKPIRYRFFKPGLLMLLTLSGTPALAMNLTEAIEQTLLKHPELREFAHRQKAQQGYIQSAGVAERPMITAQVENVMGNGSHSNINSAESGISISWVLQQSLLDKQVKAAQSRATQVNFKREIEALRLAAQTASLFVEALYFEQLLKLTRIAQNQAEQSIDLVKPKVEKGSTSQVELVEANLELARVKLAVEDAEHELKSGLYRLATQFSGDAATLRPQGNLFALHQPLKPQALFAQLSANPTLSALLNQQKVIDSQMDLTREKAQPQWRVSTGVKRFEATNDFGFSAGLSIPFGRDRRSEGELISLKARKGELEAHGEALEIAFKSELYVLLQEIEHDRHVIDTIEKQILPLLDEGMQVALRDYQVGKADYRQWLRMQQAQLSAKSELLEAYRDFHLRHIEIQRLTGTAVSL